MVRFCQDATVCYAAIADRTNRFLNKNWHLEVSNLKRSISLQPVWGMRQEAILKRSERVLPPPRMQKAAECHSHTNKEKSLDILRNHRFSSACQGTEVTWQRSSLNWKEERMRTGSPVPGLGREREDPWSREEWVRSQLQC